MSDDHARKEQEEAKRLPGYVPNLDAKLDYLLKEKGGFDLNERGRRTKRLIDTQKELADLLGVDNANVGRWRKASRIPNLAACLPTIVEIFDIDGQSFRLDDIEVFRRKCELNLPSWGRLIGSNRVSVDMAAITPLGEGEGLSARAADLERSLDEETQPVVAPGQAFRVEFVAPNSQSGVSAWAGWNVVMLCGDRDGYLTWLPRHKGEPEFKGADPFPVLYKSLVLPREGGQNLRAGRRSWGEHEVVLVVSKERVPAAIEKVLTTPAKNKELADTLDELANWLEHRLGTTLAEAAVVRAPFFVGLAAL